VERRRPDGIGFVAEVTGSEWTLTDDYGQGCSITSSYSVDRNHRFSKRAIRSGGRCPNYPIHLLPTETGRLEFSSDHHFMIEHFNPFPGDDILAYMWMRR
jgi:hypothetical protein